MGKSSVSKLFAKMIAAAAAVVFAFGMTKPVQAELLTWHYNERTRAPGLGRNIPTAINVYTDGAYDIDVTHERGFISGVQYDIIRVIPNEHAFVQVDYSPYPVGMGELADWETISRGYSYAGGINGGYFSNTEYEYGRPVGAVRRHNAWTYWNGIENTPSYGTGYATAYIDGEDMWIRYHGWMWNDWYGDDSWHWWTGYLINAEYGISGSFTYFVDGVQQDITGGASGYHYQNRAITILAQKANNEYMLITIFGGLSEETLINFLYELGAYDAIRMDGGGSTQMIYETDVIREVLPELAWTRLSQIDPGNFSEEIGYVSVKKDDAVFHLSPSINSIKASDAVKGETYPVYSSEENEDGLWYCVAENTWILSEAGVSYSDRLSLEQAARRERWAGIEAERAALARAERDAMNEPEIIDTGEEVIMGIEINTEGLYIYSDKSVNSDVLGQAIENKTYNVYEVKSIDQYIWYRIGSYMWIADADGQVSVKLYEEE